MNKVELIGRLTSDVETKEFGKGNDKGTYANFSLAVRRDEENTDFIDCTAFGKTAEFIEEYLSKGNRIAIEGSLQKSSYEDKEGEIHYQTKVIVQRQNLQMEQQKKKKDN